VKEERKKKKKKTLLGEGVRGGCGGGRFTGDRAVFRVSKIFEAFHLANLKKLRLQFPFR
jgi:hypothetical protein